ncbi:hypothetical protein HY837_02230, partial [archaeon]|nr:hypothetical protein [archaeon]
MKKILFLIVFLLLLPTVIAETFTWKLGNLDEIHGGSHTIGFTDSCDVGSKIGRELGRIGKALGLVVSNAVLAGSSQN